MTILNETIPRQGSNASANFDFRDLASGLGYEIYYGVATKSRIAVTSTQVYQLLPTAEIWPTDVNISQTAVATTTFNFDTSVFNLPRTVRGTAIFNAAIVCDEADNQESQVTVQIKKVAIDGVTVTNLSSAIVWDRSSTSSIGPNETENMLIYLDLTQTLIKKGEKLRLAVSLTMISGSGTDTVKVYCDPQERTITVGGSAQTNISTQMKLLMPFRIDQ